VLLYVYYFVVHVSYTFRMVPAMWAELVEGGFVEHAERWAWDWYYRASVRCRLGTAAQEINIDQERNPRTTGR